jgi:hypothetical protein
LISDEELEKRIIRFLKIKNQYFSTVFYNWEEDEEYQALLSFIKEILEDERR